MNIACCRHVVERRLASGIYQSVELALYRVMLHIPAQQSKAVSRGDLEATAWSDDSPLLRRASSGEATPEDPFAASAEKWRPQEGTSHAIAIPDLGQQL